MKKIKKAMAMVLFCVLTCCICLSFVGCKIGIGLRLYESEYFIYTVSYETNEIGILGLTDKGKEQEYLVIPETIDGKKVYSIGCYTGLEVTRIKETYGDAKYAQFKSETLKKIFIASKIKIVPLWSESPFVDCPNLEALLYIFNDAEPVRGRRIYRSAFMSYQMANVSYYYNYETAPNDGYYWIDNYEYGEGIEYIPEKPTREGYTFGGWYKESECVNVWDFETDRLPETQYNEEKQEIYQETKLYAKWIKN